MKPSDNLYDFIKQEEGVVLHSYRDSAGIYTIGIGSTMYKSGKRVGPGEHITIEEALDLLSWEVNNKSASVSHFVSQTRLNQNQYNALVSFAYNVGIGALQNSTLLKKVKINPSDPFIRNEFLKWVYITVNGKKVVSKGLQERRQREWELFSRK